MPSTMPTASSPARNGSSEKYSKLRPHKGDRFMLTPGPRITDRLHALASWARAWPMRRNSSGFQADATAEAVGKQVAGSEPPRPRWSLSLGWARRPCGPSETIILGTPSRSTGAVYQNEEPLVRDAFSSRVSSVSSWSMSSVTGYLTFLLGKRAGPNQAGDAGGVQQQVVVLVVGTADGEEGGADQRGNGLLQGRWPCYYTACESRWTLPVRSRARARAEPPVLAICLPPLSPDKLLRRF